MIVIYGVTCLQSEVKVGYAVAWRPAASQEILYCIHTPCGLEWLMTLHRKFWELYRPSWLCSMVGAVCCLAYTLECGLGARWHSLLHSFVEMWPHTAGINKKFPFHVHWMAIARAPVLEKTGLERALHAMFRTVISRSVPFCSRSRFHSVFYTHHAVSRD